MGKCQALAKTGVMRSFVLIQLVAISESEIDYFIARPSPIFIIIIFIVISLLLSLPSVCNYFFTVALFRYCICIHISALYEDNPKGTSCISYYSSYFIALFICGHTAREEDDCVFAKWIKFENPKWMIQYFSQVSCGLHMCIILSPQCRCDADVYTFHSVSQTWAHIRIWRQWHKYTNSGKSGSTHLEDAPNSARSTTSITLVKLKYSTTP